MWQSYHWFRHNSYRLDERTSNGMCIYRRTEFQSVLLFISHKCLFFFCSKWLNLLLLFWKYFFLSATRSSSTCKYDKLYWKYIEIDIKITSHITVNNLHIFKSQSITINYNWLLFSSENVYTYLPKLKIQSHLSWDCI